LNELRVYDSLTAVLYSAADKKMVVMPVRLDNPATPAPRVQAEAEAQVRSFRSRRVGPGSSFDNKRCSSFAQDCVEIPFQSGVAATATDHNILGPIQLLALSLQRPVNRLCRIDIPEIANFIGKLDLLGLGG